MHKACILTILLVLKLSGSEGQSVPDQHSPQAADSVWTQTNIKAFEKEIEALRERYHIPGLSVGIVKDKQLAWDKGFGFADVENKIVPNENTVYQIASLTKTFGAILLMQQVEAGKVSLDDGGICRGTSGRRFGYHPGKPGGERHCGPTGN
jgi:CubicO group peptidase (beta-lactamase class C family)